MGRPPNACSIQACRGLPRPLLWYAACSSAKVSSSDTETVQPGGFQMTHSLGCASSTRGSSKDPEAGPDGLSKGARSPSREPA